MFRRADGRRGRRLKIRDGGCRAAVPDDGNAVRKLHGGRPYTAWWLRYPGREERAVKLLAQFKPAVERQISYWQKHCPGQADWETVLWEAAYRAAWRCDGPHFWPLLRFAMLRKVSQYRATHMRRNERLKRVDLTPDDFEAAVSGMGGRGQGGN